MHAVKIALITYILFHSTYGMQSQLAPSRQTSDISYSLVSDELTLREPVKLSFSVHNAEPQKLRADLGWQGAQNFQFVIIKPDGSETQFSPPLKEGFTPSGNIEVKPGQTYSKQLLLNEWFEFSELGRYQISVLLMKPVIGEDGQVVINDRGAHLALNVLAHNEQHLQKVCAELAGRILSAKSYDEVDEAANALGAIQDPIAVPYLKQVTGFWHLESMTTGALARIGDQTAVEVLILLIHSKDSETALLAHSALMRVERQTADKQLKEKIRKTLQPLEKN